MNMITKLAITGITGIALAASMVSPTYAWHPKGEIVKSVQNITAKGDIELNSGRATLKIKVANTGDRPIQVGSHYHFFETNPALKFDREKTKGMRLAIASGTAVRFEPGQSREVTLVAMAGKREVYGFRQDVMGKL